MLYSTVFIVSFKKFFDFYCFIFSVFESFFFSFNFIFTVLMCMFQTSCQPTLAIFTDELTFCWFHLVLALFTGLSVTTYYLKHPTYRKSFRLRHSRNGMAAYWLLGKFAAGIVRKSSPLIFRAQDIGRWYQCPRVWCASPGSFASESWKHSLDP